MDQAVQSPTLMVVEHIVIAFFTFLTSALSIVLLHKRLKADRERKRANGEVERGVCPRCKRRDGGPWDHPPGVQP